MQNLGKLRKEPLKFDENGKIIFKEVVFTKNVKGKEKTFTEFRCA